MGVRKEDGVGTPKLVIDRRPRKSVPIRLQYREFGGRVERQPGQFPIAAAFFIVLLGAYVAVSLLVLNLFVVFVLGFVVTSFGAGFYLYPFMRGRIHGRR
jgi:hypothetical protein